MLRPRRSTFFPYTPLFRSSTGAGTVGTPVIPSSPPAAITDCPTLRFSDSFQDPNFWTTEMSNWGPLTGGKKWIAHKADARSEEHTSELQSPDHLVCLPLLD